MRTRLVAALGGLLLLAGCASTAGSGAGEGADSAAPVLVGTPWALVRIQSMDDSVYTPAEPDRFWIEMREGGELVLKVDCNRGRGAWRSEGPGQLRFGPIATTRAFCGPDSLHDRFLRDLGFVRSYVFRDGRLFLATMADGAILELRRLDELPGAAGPAFDCASAEGSAEERICEDAELATLDRQLDALYRKALETFPAEEQDLLKATQRGWIKGRNDCWKAGDLRACILQNYDLRITELQIQTGSVVVPEPLLYTCEDGGRLSVYAYDDTRIPSAVLNRHPDQVLVFRVRAASGVKYEGRNLLFWSRGDEAQLVWLGRETLCTRDGAS